MGFALRRPMTVPNSVFQCSLWTSPNSSKETNTSRLWRSFSFQMLKVFPCMKKHYWRQVPVPVLLMSEAGLHLRCCCFFVWSCWPLQQTSPSHCLPASLELNAPAAETGESFFGQPSSGPSRWRKRVVFCRRKKMAGWPKLQMGKSGFSSRSGWNSPA